MEKLYEEAIQYVMGFYDQSREDVINYYWDEVEAYMRIQESEKLCE